MLYLKKVLFVCTILILSLSCSKGEKKIMATYDDGRPFIIEYTKEKNGKTIKTYEEHYYKNGKIRLEGRFNGEKRSGTWKFYYEDGTLFAQADFSKVKEGMLWRVYFNKDSLLVDDKDKLLNIAFSKEGTPVSITVKRGAREIFYRFFNSFRLMERVFLKGNIPQGEAISWHENGNVNSIHYYQDGLQDSTYVVYAESGQRILTGQYKRGIKIGKWEFFSSEGVPLGYEIYDMDGTQLSITDNQGLKYYTTPPTQNNK